METIVYILRAILVSLSAWFCVRLIGKRSLAQMTSYDFAAVLILANVVSEPLVFKVASKAVLGGIVISLSAVLIGRISLFKPFYNTDANPSILIVNGKVDRAALKRNRLNLPFLLSLLREKGYANVTEVEYAILEPNGNLSVLPKSQVRPVRPKDLGIPTAYEGLALPLILDGEVQYNNLKFAHLTMDWLMAQLQSEGFSRPEEVFLVELDSSGVLSIVPCTIGTEGIPDLY